jgi:hypothetical protein
MTITFADGTRIEVAAAAFDDFVKHDLKWVEFVHGSARKPVKAQSSPSALEPQMQNVQRCPAC